MRRWALLDGGVQGAKAAASDAYRHRHTLRFAASPPIPSTPAQRYAVLRQPLRRGDPPRHLLDECESIKARHRRAIRRPRLVPDRNKQPRSASTSLPVRSIRPGADNARWATRWKPALNAFAITFKGRITLTGN